VSITADVTWLVAVMLVSLRFGTILLMSPVFNFINLPIRVRVGLTLVLAALMVTGLGSARLGRS